MDISVIICTCNRIKDLPDAINSVWGQEFLSTGEYELIIVDNASTDDTQEYVNGCLKNSPLPMRYVYEGKPGLSGARNTGAEAARGEVLAYLDDDAIASPYWLAEIRKAYQNNEELSAGGGRILLKWLVERPSWLNRDLESALTCLDLGAAVKSVDRTSLPSGANFSCRKTVWREVGGFSPGLTLYNDEIFFFTRVLEKGGTILYLPDAIVWHKVNPYRVTRRYFLKRNFMQGEADVLLDVKENHHHLGWRTMAYRARGLACKFAKRVFEKPSELGRFGFWLWVVYDAGLVTGCVRFSSKKVKENV